MSASILSVVWESLSTDPQTHRLLSVVSLGVWFQDAGAAFLVEGLPQSGVTRVWMKNTGISEPMQSRIHRCCVENALRRLAADDPTLSALHWFGTPTHDTAAERRGVAPGCCACLHPYSHSTS